MVTEEQKNIIKSIIGKHKPKMIGVFGSYARGDEKKESDLDILIDLEDNLNLLDIIGLEQELSDQLGLKVELITSRSLDPQLKPYIDRDLILL